MYKLEFTLKQHTPIIHFQHDQEGATLRATEVKPKLDKFLREILIKIKPEIYTEFKKLIGKIPDPNKQENLPSPYKLVIQPIDVKSQEKCIIASYIPRQNKIEYERKYRIFDRTPYFADNTYFKNGNLNDAKLGLMLKEGRNLKLVFHFIDNKWESLINKTLPLFLVSTNFGSRQSKGFGCFLPSNLTQNEFEIVLKAVYPICFKSKPFNYPEDVFSGIDSIYKTLKSGDRNHESELRKYFNSFRPVIDWEKPEIQKKVAMITGSRLIIRSKTNDEKYVKFVRALLGLPEIFEYPKNGGIKSQVKFEKNKDDDTIIERYGSPILFKVFDKTIYLTAVINEYSKTMLNKRFNFSFTHNGKDYGSLLNLQTPDQFNIVEFLNISMRSQFSWRKI